MNLGFRISDFNRVNRYRKANLDTLYGAMLCLESPLCMLPLVIFPEPWRQLAFAEGEMLANGVIVILGYLMARRLKGIIRGVAYVSWAYNGHGTVFLSADVVAGRCHISSRLASQVILGVYSYIHEDYPEQVRVQYEEFEKLYGKH